jgi:tetratricopeptide (TPR) repeat protein
MNRKERRAAARARRSSSNKAHKEPELTAPPVGIADLLATGRRLHEAGRLSDAEICYRQLLAVQPNNANGLNLLGIVTHQMASSKLVSAREQRGKLNEAIALYRQAISINPNYAEALANLGVALEEQGKLDDARSAFERAIQVAPARAATYRLLSALKRFTATDPHITAMENLARGMTSLSPEEQIDLHFALGKACRDLGDRARSFHHLLEGNALNRKRIVYDEQAIIATFGRIRSLFTPKLMRDRQGGGHTSSVPVFIVGMPRSGTTLVEQILASHPKVFGAGELSAFGNTVESLSNANAAKGQFPELVSSISDGQLWQIGANYVNAITVLAPRAERIVDKMPMNFHFVGLIYLTLPNARIIHMRRDPLDTCLSCYSKLFTDRHQYSYDLGELGRYYRAYETLMEHWRRILPPSFMLEVQYEDLIEDLESEGRRIVDHCGLEWDASCLSFYVAERPVRTASAAQVRQPIYRSSIGRWRAYAHQLGPLIEALGVDIGGSAGRAPEIRARGGAPTTLAVSATKSPHNEVATTDRADTGGSFSPPHLVGESRDRQKPGEVPTRQIVIDGIKTVAIHNGLLRVDCVANGSKDKEWSPATLLIPGNQARPILKALAQAVQELEIEIYRRVHQRGGAVKTPD